MPSVLPTYLTLHSEYCISLIYEMHYLPLNLILGNQTIITPFAWHSPWWNFGTVRSTGVIGLVPWLLNFLGQARHPVLKKGIMLQMYLYYLAVGNVLTKSPSIVLTIVKWDSPVEPQLWVQGEAFPWLCWGHNWSYRGPPHPLYGLNGPCGSLACILELNVICICCKISLVWKTHWPLYVLTRTSTLLCIKYHPPVHISSNFY